jgi:hypothetical protein
MIDIGMEENEVGMELEGIYLKAVGFHDYIIIIINK